MNNVIIAFYNKNARSNMLIDILSIYTALFCFYYEDMPDGLVPDVIIITEENPFLCIESLHKIKSKYNGIQVICMRDVYDIYSFSALVYSGFIYMLNFKCLPKELYKVILYAANQENPEISSYKRQRALFSIIHDYFLKGFTTLDYAVLCGIVRSIRYRKLGKLLGVAPYKVNGSRIKWQRYFGFKDTTKLVNLDFLKKYGSLCYEHTPKFLTFAENKKTKDYYVIPRIWEE